MTELWTLAPRNLPGQFQPWTLYPKPIDGTGGQGNFLILDGEHYQFIRRLNADNIKVMQNLVWPKGGSIYLVEAKQRKAGKTWKNCTAVAWPMLCLAGHNPTKEALPNMVNVLEWWGAWAMIQGINHGANTALLNHDDYPHLVHRVWCGSKGLNDMPKGAAFMPIFFPFGFAGTPAAGSGLWIKREALAARWG